MSAVLRLEVKIRLAEIAMGRQPRFSHALSFVVLACAHGAAQASFYSVGPSGLCTHHTVQAAVDAAVADVSTGPHFILLPIGTVFVPNGVVVQNAANDLHIVGGYENCATYHDGMRTVLDASGGANGTVLDIRSSATQMRTISLEALEITGGTGETGSGTSSEGAGLELRGNLDVQLLRDTRVRDNQALRGGGVFMHGGPGHVLLHIDQGSTIRNNIAGADGGGIYCDNLGKVFLVDGSIDGNQAGHNGGGVWLGTYCGLEVSAITGAFDSISANQAQQSGGGIYFESGSPLAQQSIQLSAVPGNPVFMLGNSARLGGAAYIISTARTQANFYNVVFANNATTAPGSAFPAVIGVEGALDLRIEGAPTRACSGGFIDFGLCSVITGANDVAIRLLPGSGPGQTPRLAVRRTRFLGNESTLIYTPFEYDAEDTLDLHSVIIDDNSGASALVRSGGPINLRYSTITGNTNAGLISVETAPGADSRVDLTGSLIWNPGMSIVAFVGGGTGSAIHNGCLLAHSATGISNPTAVRVTNPQLTADFTPGATSPALDVCNTFLDAPLRDVYGTVRPVDQLVIANALGSYDLGAVERTLDVADRIFANGFE